MSNLIPKYLTLPFEIKAADESGRIEGYASAYGNIDLGLDIVKKGAFKKSLKENKGIVPILFQHNPDEQLGWNEKAEEDDTGLFVSGLLNLEVARARERHALAKQALKLKAPSGLSIGYYTIKASPDRENPRIRVLEELKLFEYSMVTFPMNTSAFITAAKSINAVDKANFFLAELKRHGISVKDLEYALAQEGKNLDYDPLKVNTALDNLILKFKS